MNTVADDGSTVNTGWLHRQTVVVVVLALTTSMSVGFAVAEGLSELAEAQALPVVPMAPGYGPQPPVVLPEPPDPPAEPTGEPQEPQDEPCPDDSGPDEADEPGPQVTVDLEAGEESDPPQFEVPDDEIPGGDLGVPPNFWESLPIEVCDDPRLSPVCDLTDGGSEWIDDFLPTDGSGWEATDPGDWSSIEDGSWIGEVSPVVPTGRFGLSTVLPVVETLKGRW